MKFAYRKHINQIFKLHKIHYSDYFENLSSFLKKENTFANNKVIEIMLHPDFDDLSGKLIDHFDTNAIIQWLDFLAKSNA